MADLVVVEAEVAATKPLDSEFYSGIAAEAITAGQACYQNSAGKLALTDADAAASALPKGIAMQTVGAGQALSVLKRGPMEGFTITQAYDAPIFISNTAGALADAQPSSGDFRFVVGRIVAASDKDLTKLLYVDISYSAESTAL